MYHTRNLTAKHSCQYTLIVPNVSGACLTTCPTGARAGGIGKYSRSGMFKKGTFQQAGISNSEAAVLAGYANLGLAKNTHDTYHSAEACLRRCEADTGELLNLPWGSRETYKFFLYMESKNFTAETMRTYMAGIRNLHIRNNYKDISLHSPLMSLILKGKQHSKLLAEKLSQNNNKLTMGIPVMKLLKKRLTTELTDKHLKSLYWAYATMAWSGSFRCNELLSRRAKTFNQQTTLLWRDIRMRKETHEGKPINTIEVFIKSPKIDKVGAGDIIKIFETGSFMCPYRAFTRYATNFAVQEQNKPVFVLPSGNCLTGDRVNAVLKNILSREIGTLTSHSFRAGLPTEMALAGCFEEGQIMSVGRWSSDAYKHYVKTPLLRRAHFAKQMIDRMA